MESLKTLIEIDRQIWSQTRAYATANNCTLKVALESLLSEILVSKGYVIRTTKNQLANSKQEEKR
ncbi:MAG TPA: hypothetical protein VFG24_00555 [Nitrosopumilaceae archaeon]|nr:hypothetical protein [Nitrosopumilaceae archaeon]